MTIESQVVSAELAYKLKELGVKQESLFYFFGTDEEFIKQKGYGGPAMIGKNDYKWATKISAFTVAELGEILPATPKIDGKIWYLECCKYANWQVKYVHYNSGVGHILGGYPIFSTGSEADARAKMLIYLLENKYIELPV